ncbi:glycosyltransferase [Patescibacteria group bacterium]|nr:glycosyltransferase [Patescibacteria group bacterium]MBU4512161.1 glycosyltransferase [Patescibacteria group bacterium]MCG2693035.1 glycosyltransferase [Candidatus Parcubacteria bacterium]
MKIALAHDHLNQLGGAEKVLFAFHEVYPRAPIYTLIHDSRSARGVFDKLNIKTSFLQKMPGGLRHMRWYLSWMPAAFESLDLTGYDVVLSDASAFAKGAIVSSGSLHICYCHTPTRYLWSDTHQYVKELKQGWLIKKILPLVLNKLRAWDYQAAQRVDNFIANSCNVQKRIKKYYRRESDVIYPPVEVEHFKIADELGKYYLIGGRLVSYKRFDLAIKAFNKLGIPLKIFGTGPEEEKLRKMAKNNIEFLGQVSDNKKAELYSRALGFIHPHEEDFGITAVESMAAGRPVIAYKKGGALETVIDGETGVFFEEQEWEALADAVIRFEPSNFDPVKIREHALGFGKDRFKREMVEFVEKKWKEFQAG